MGVEYEARKEQCEGSFGPLLATLKELGGAKLQKFLAAFFASMSMSGKEAVWMHLTTGTCCNYDRYLIE